MSDRPLLAVQYYRPPFPERRDWARDLAAITDAGIDAIQLWLTWGWIEAEPGVYRFDDIDEIVSLAENAGLGVVLSTIAEVHPFWIHRVVPGSELVDHLGRPVVSTSRRENHAGLTPGGCTDHPGVRDRMGAFLRACAERYRDRAGLCAWDVWNETRWAVHAPGHVCYCPHTLEAFRLWLRDEYGDLDGLNRAWERRYVDWADVRPGTVPKRLYTETMEFQRFLTHRSGRHMAFRAEQIRSLDSEHLVGAHGVAASVFSPGVQNEQAVSRGNDWDHVASLDAYGLSMYPDFFVHDEADFGARIEAVASACGPKPLWISELEAAPTGVGFTAGRPVTGTDLQRWIWAAIGHGAAGIVLWQWYDELIGEESASFGLAGHDGLAEERLAALRELAAVRSRWAEELAVYEPEAGRVGVLFDESGYHLDWAQSGADADLVSGGVIGYLRALERIGVPYRVIDGRHLDADILSDLRLIVVPAPLTVSGEVAERLASWANGGGLLVVETEAGSYTRTGIYRYPDRRPAADAFGIRGEGRWPMVEARGSVSASVGGRSFELTAAGWIEPVSTVENDGSGHVVAVGTFAGTAYHRRRTAGFEAFVSELVTAADAWGDLRILSSAADADQREVFLRCGRTRGGRLVFLANPGDRDRDVRLRLPEPGRLIDLASQEPVSGDPVDAMPVVRVPSGCTRVLFLQDAAARHPTPEESAG